MRAQNLKFICAILFAMVFLVGGLFINLTKVNAEEVSQSFPYSLSAVQSYPNNVGGVTTVVHIGCVPGSGDKYDINTGKLCPYSVVGARIACAKGSGDIYDINTGKRCVYLASNVMIGCASNSSDLYDINTGKRCIKNSAIQNSNIVAKNTGESERTTLNVTPILTEGELIKDSILDEDIENNLTASGGRINSLFAWPLSTRGIALIVVLILGIGYGVYSFFKKDSSVMPIYEMKKNKKEEVKPIVTTPETKPTSQPTPINTNVQPVKKPEQPVAPVVNTVTENKPQDSTPLVNQESKNASPQMNLNMSSGQNREGSVK